MADSTRETGIRISSDPEKTIIHGQTAERRAQRAVELPLRLLLVSDLVPDARISGWSGPSRIRVVDKNSFGELLREWSPRLRIEVPNLISNTPRELEIELHFHHLDDFHPFTIARQVPPLATLLDVRKLIDEVQKGEISLPDFRTGLHELGIDKGWAEQLYEKLAASTGLGARSGTSTGTDVPVEPEDEKGALDRLLGMVDLGDESAISESPAPDTRSARAMDALLQAITGAPARKPVPEPSAASMLVQELDEKIEEQVNAILCHAAVRKLESAWRGLKFLVDRINFRARIQLEVLAAEKKDLDDALYHQVLIPEHERKEGPPLSMMIVDHTFGNMREDISLLEDLADTAASMQVPLIGTVSHEFFGVAQASGLARLPVLRQYLERPEYLEWHKLRAKEKSGYLALALPSFLLRPSYGHDHPAEGFVFTETGALWGNASLLVGAAVASGFVTSGWPTHFMGPGYGTGNLPVFRSESGSIPLQAIFPEKTQLDLSDAGFVVVACYPNRDEAYIAHAPVVRKPEVYEDSESTAEARAHTQLATQLFVSRAAHYLWIIQNELEKGLPPDEVKQLVAKRLASSLGVSGDHVPVDVERMADRSLPDRDVYAVRLRPPTSVLSYPVSLIMGLYAPK